MRAPKLFAAVAFCIVTIPTVDAQTQKLAAAAAKDHVGEREIVCGQVASTRYASKSKGEPTFLNLDQPYPKQIFTILIWGSDRPKFGQPESKYQGRRVCVTGKITSYQSSPEIVVNDPAQLQIEK